MENPQAGRPKLSLSHGKKPEPVSNALAKLQRRADANPAPAPSPVDEAARLALETSKVLCRLWLSENYPEVFSSSSPKPLAVGTGLKLRSMRPDGVSNKALKITLHRWVNQKSYHAAVAKGGPRYGLDGTEAGEITSKAKAHAAKQLKRTGSKS